MKRVKLEKNENSEERELEEPEVADPKETQHIPKLNCITKFTWRDCPEDCDWKWNHKLIEGGEWEAQDQCGRQRCLLHRREDWEGGLHSCNENCIEKLRTHRQSGSTGSEWKRDLAPGKKRFTQILQGRKSKYQTNKNARNHKKGNS